MTDLHVQIRRLPKPVVAMVAGYAIGGGHVLHLVCDLTIAAENARFGQVGPKVGSFDGGFGAGLLANLVGPRRPRRSGSCAASTRRRRPSQMGLVNTVVPLERLEDETVQWCREMLALSPFALRLLKASFNAAEDGLAGIQQLAHDANLLFYGSEEAQEGRDAYSRSAARLRPLPAAGLMSRRMPTDAATGDAAPPGRPARASAVRIWVMAARVRTLPAAIAPVLVGTSLALGAGRFEALAFVAALLGAIFIQVGTNLSNDYSDARRGADTEDRLGPVRVTAGGLVPPRQVLIATYVTFGLAVLCGIYLIAVAGWELLAVGAARSSRASSTRAARAPMATKDWARSSCSSSSGSSRSRAPTSCRSSTALAGRSCCAVPVGLLASAILVVNNVRDLETDRRAGKRTLAVRLGRERTRTLYTAMLARRLPVRPAAVAARLDDAWLLLRWAAIPLAVGARRVVRTRIDGPSLNGALAQTGALQLVFCLLFAAGILASGGIALVRLARPRASARRRRFRRSGGAGASHAAEPLRRGPERELFTVALSDARRRGYGEAAPLEPYDGVEPRAGQRGAGRLPRRADAVRRLHRHAADRRLPARLRRARRARRRRPRAVGPRRTARGQAGGGAADRLPRGGRPVNATLSAHRPRRRRRAGRGGRSAGL